MADHVHSHAASEKRIFWVMVLTAVFMVIEVIGGLLSGSLALLADAGHMLTDAAALALAWFAFRIARRPSDALRTFGYHRFQVLAAFANGLALAGIGVWIVIEAVRRLIDPIEILAGPMLGVATGGFIINIVAVYVLHGGDRKNINLHGAMLHVMGDLLGSAAAIIAALVILRTGWTPIDPILSLVVALIVMWSAYGLVRRTAHILLEGSPEDFEPEAVKAALIEAVPEITDVHHLHAWSLTSERPLATLHAVVREDADHLAVLRQIRDILATRHGIGHATI